MEVKDLGFIIIQMIAIAMGLDKITWGRSKDTEEKGAGIKTWILNRGRRASGGDQQISKEGKGMLLRKPRAVFYQEGNVQVFLKGPKKSS